MARTHTRLPIADDTAAAQAAEPEDGRARLGTVVDDRYRIVDIIGVGGMGVVYRAEHVFIRRMVALKILDPQMARAPQILERFEREALAIGRLEHPNCVSVLDFGKLADGSCYLTMPCLEGPTLGDRLREGRIPMRRALRIARHLASALAHIHRAGIVHRDVKPENIVLVDREGDADFATLLDFGIAKLLSREGDAGDQNELTVLGQRFGTPEYMSPEQVVGAPPDERADIYALCVVLFEMLCGTRPFDDDDPVRLMELQERAPVPAMASAVPDIIIPEKVEALVRKGLAKRPAERHADAMALIAAIDDCLEAPDDDQETMRPLYRRPRVLAVAGAGLLVIAAAAFWLWPRAPVESPASARARALLEQGKVTQAIALLEGHPALAEHSDTHVQLGHAYVAAGRHGDALAAYRRALARERRFARDQALLGNLQLILEADDVERAAQAADLLLSEIRHRDTGTLVVEMAGSHGDHDTRQRMRRIAEHHGLSEDVDWLSAYTLDLAQAPTCAARREATVQLRALGDPRAIPALEKARARDGNDCLRDAAGQAATYLRRQAAASP